MYLFLAIVQKEQLKEKTNLVPADVLSLWNKWRIQFYDKKTVLLQMVALFQTEE